MTASTSCATDVDGISCDACGKSLLIEEDIRYEVRIDVRAAYDPLEITPDDLNRDLDAERRRLLEQMKGLSSEEAMDQVHRAFKFDLCPPCQRRYVKRPLNPGEGSASTPA